jgi:hypothetical protein
LGGLGLGLVGDEVWSEGAVGGGEDAQSAELGGGGAAGARVCALVRGGESGGWLVGKDRRRVMWMGGVREEG